FLQLWSPFAFRCIFRVRASERQEPHHLLPDTWYQNISIRSGNRLQNACLSEPLLWLPAHGPDRSEREGNSCFGSGIVRPLFSSPLSRSRESGKRRMYPVSSRITDRTISELQGL